jgi:uncharacterized protein (DUF488 family)
MYSVPDADRPQVPRPDADARAGPSRGPLYTVGHGTLPEADFIELVRNAGVDGIVDVRSYPGSRRNPQYGRAPLEQWLPGAGVAYTWDPRLGGRRRPVATSLNTALRHEAFQGYADHMGTPEFRAALDGLVRSAATSVLAVMCSESVWWRCHRRLLADALVLLRDVPVIHLFHDGRQAAHQPSPEARVAGDRLIYDLGAAPQLL